MFSGVPIIFFQKGSKSNEDKLWPQQMMIHQDNHLYMLIMKPHLTCIQVIQIIPRMRIININQCVPLHTSTLENKTNKYQVLICLPFILQRLMDEVHQPCFNQLQFIFKENSWPSLFTDSFLCVYLIFDWNCFQLYKELFLKEDTIVPYKQRNVARKHPQPR